MRAPADDAPSAEALLGAPPSAGRPIQVPREDSRGEPERSHNVRFASDQALPKLPGLRRFASQLQESSTAHAGEDITLLVNFGDPCTLVRQGRQLVLGTGEGMLTSGSEPSRAVCSPPSDVMALRIPRHRLARLLPRIEHGLMRVIPRDTFALRLLRDYVGMPRQDGAPARRELQELALSHIHDLVAVALSASQDGAGSTHGRGTRAARLSAIKHDIARNLKRGDLSIGALAQRHGCTPRCVQRLFENDGTTFTDYVLAERLACAHGMLADPSRRDEKIAAIAYEAGFSDLSYFNRVFRRHYGGAPSATRARPRPGASAPLMFPAAAASLALAAELSGALCRLPP